MKTRVMLGSIMLCIQISLSAQGACISNFRTVSLYNDKSSNLKFGNNKVYIVKNDYSLYLIEEINGKYNEVKVMDDIKGVYYGRYVIKNDNSLWVLQDREHMNEHCEPSNSIPYKVMDEVMYISTNCYNTLVVKKNNTLLYLEGNNKTYTDDNRQKLYIEPVKLMNNVYSA